jgi:DNA polymerase-3 subunit epsilon
MGYALAILAIVLVAGFLMARRHGATGTDNTPELSSRGITTPRPQIAYPDRITADVSNDREGNVLFNENIKPTRKKRMSQEAVAIHGLTMKALSSCRTFAELAEPLERAIGGKTVIAYNALFDGRMYAQTLKLAGGYLHRGDWADIMDEYAKYVGEWDDYHQNYRWQRLPGGTHSALGDCQATLELLRKMAATSS